MDGALESVERDLPHHGIDHVLDLGGEHGLALFVVAGVGQQFAERQHFAEHARGLGKRQRGGRHQGAVRRGQHLMHAVAELVRQRHHVARLALIVEQHIGMRRRRGRMRERARRLARPHRCVDPALGKKLLGDRRHFRRERAVSGKHGVHRLGPADGALRDRRQRRVAIPVRQFLFAEPFGFERVVAVRQPRIGGAHGRDQSIDHFALDPIVEMPRIGDVGKAAPAVGDFLVLGERIGDQREIVHVFAQTSSPAPARRPCALTRSDPASD